MRSFLFITCTIFLFIASFPCQAAPVTELILDRAFFIDGPENSQPSGLTIKEGTLFTVSDKHDSTIFKLRLSADKAVMEPYLTFTAPRINEHSYTARHDFEGLTCDSQGNFYLVSESRFRILRVSADGTDASWVTPNLKSNGIASGLFKKANAYFEGITLIRPGLFLLCAERQPRGFMTVDISNSVPRVDAWQSNQTLFEFKKGIHPDFSGLWADNKRLFVLERNAYLVCRMAERSGRWEEQEGWSYRHIVTRPEYRYADTKYGKAEGLCMDKKSVHIILDNNNGSRESAPDDSRPLLLICPRPDLNL